VTADDVVLWYEEVVAVEVDVVEDLDVAVCVDVVV
jgi:hypothetical protein